MSDPDGKERLTSNEFRELIPHLPLADLLRIEYRKDKWYQLVNMADPHKKLYGCMLCSITNSNAKNLNAHFEGKKHKLNLQEVKQFFHPEYTYMKHEQKLAAGGAAAAAVQKPAAVKPAAKVQPKTQGVAKANAPTTEKTLATTSKANPAKVAAKPAAKPKVLNKTSSTPEPSVSVKPESTAVKSDASVSTAKEGVAVKPDSSINSSDSLSSASTVPPKENQNSKKSSDLNTPSEDSTVGAASPKTDNSKPANGSNVVPVSKPVTGAKSTTDVKAATGVKPTAVSKPVTGVKPASGANLPTGAQSAVGAKPATGVKSAPAVKPTAGAKPSPATKPATPETPKTSRAVKSTAGAKPTSVTKPATSEIPKASTAIKSTAGAKTIPATKSATPKESTASEIKATGPPKKVPTTTMSAAAKTAAVAKTTTVAKAASPITVAKAASPITVAKAASPKTVSNTKASPVTKPATNIKTTPVSKTATTAQKPTTPAKPTPKKPAEINTNNGAAQDTTKATATQIPSEVSANSPAVSQPNTIKVEVKTEPNSPAESRKSDANAVSKTNTLANDKSSKSTDTVGKKPMKEAAVSSNTKITNKSAEHTQPITQTGSTNTARSQNIFSDDVQFDEMPVQFDASTTLVKNPCAMLRKRGGSNSSVLKTVTPTKVIKETNPDVIVIDADQCSNNENSSVGGDISMAPREIVKITDLAPKPQRVRSLKRSIEIKTDDKDSLPQDDKNLPASKTLEDDKSNSEDPVTKKPKIVINPAAAYLEAAQGKTDEKAIDNEKPKYQTDRIIIPTIHKSKAPSSQPSEPLKQNTQPKFSSKTYSAKPSDNDVLGLIGVEYVIKIMKHRDDVSPKYECGLCEIVLDGTTMQNHLVGYNHRLKFCEKHFPTAIRQYKQNMAKVPPHETFKVLTPILGKLAIAIEQHHGRDLPYECLEKNYNSNRNEILSKVYSRRHASDQLGPSFTHVVDSREIDKYIAERNNFRPQPGPHVQTFNVRQGAVPHTKPRTTDTTRHSYPAQRRDHVHPMENEQRSNYPNTVLHNEYPPTSDYNTPYVAPVDDEIHKQMVADFLRGTSSHHTTHRNQGRQYDRERRSRRSRDRVRHRSRSRSNSRRRSISPLRDGDIWQAYRHLVDQKVRDLKEVFKLYRKDPETHPMYNDEWQKFWKRRKDELIAAGLDHRSYDYQPEWVRFFKVRIEELYSQAMENIKIQSRERLCLPMTNDELADPTYHVYVPNAFPDVYPSMEEEVDNNQHIQTTNISEPMSNPEVLPVLRLMTALEEYLGSLGPKIIELMSKALSVEKINPTQINNVILTTENCTLLETAMEKLKGVLFAGLLEGPKNKAFKKVISETTHLLEFAANERKKNPPKPVSNDVVSFKKTTSYVPMNTTPVVAPMLSNVPSTTLPPVSNFTSSLTQPTVSKGSNSAIGALLAQVDKKELAVKLAATLTAQGKTDFNPEQLEQLIAVYTVMEKKKREAAAATSSPAAPVPLPQPTAVPSRKLLSDTLVDFMNPSNPNTPIINPSSARPLLPEDSSAKQSYTTATINRYLDLMRRTGGGAAAAGSGFANKQTNEVWQNLQNIQRDMNLGGFNTSQNINSANPASNSGRSSFGFSSSARINSTYRNMNTNSLEGNNQSQFEFNKSSTSNNDFKINSNPQSSSYRYGSGGGNLNTFSSGMGGNLSQQNSYLGNTVGMNSLAAHKASGSLFANNNNNSRVGNNSSNISSTTSQQQQRKDIPYQQPTRTKPPMPVANPDQNWVTNTGSNLGGSPFAWRNQKNGGGGAVPRPNPGGTGNMGKNQNWRNN